MNGKEATERYKGDHECKKDVLRRKEGRKDVRWEEL